MLKAEQTRLLKGLISHLDAKTNVDAGGIMKTPAETYTCEEQDNIFVQFITDEKYHRAFTMVFFALLENSYSLFLN